jgi:hypothetical protein
MESREGAAFCVGALGVLVVAEPERVAADFVGDAVAPEDG